MVETTNTLGSVLVVEDEEDYAALLAAMLRNGGYQVRVAYDGVEALKKVQEQVPDLITLDIQMPRKTGIHFFREMRPQPSLRDVPVVVVTGLTVDDRDMETFIHSFLDVEHLPIPDAYLEKPVEADQLLLVVGDAIGKRAEG
ncbi:MAG: response regulator [Anaerolineae bacterium]|nr:response regulator [Anaerolineae bacterium]